MWRGKRKRGHGSDEFTSLFGFGMGVGMRAEKREYMHDYGLDETLLLWQSLDVARCGIYHEGLWRIMKYHFPCLACVCILLLFSSTHDAIASHVGLLSALISSQ